MLTARTLFVMLVLLLALPATAEVSVDLQGTAVNTVMHGVIVDDARAELCVAPCGVVL